MNSSNFYFFHVFTKEQKKKKSITIVILLNTGILFFNFLFPHHPSWTRPRKYYYKRMSCLSCLKPPTNTNFSLSLYIYIYIYIYLQLYRNLVRFIIIHS